MGKKGNESWVKRRRNKEIKGHELFREKYGEAGEKYGQFKLKEDKGNESWVKRRRNEDIKDHGGKNCYGRGKNMDKRGKNMDK